MRAGWRRERCLVAAAAVLARTVTVERRLEDAAARLPVEALADHPLWDYPTIYDSPLDGVPGVIDVGRRTALVDELSRVEPAARRLDTAVQQLQLLGGQAVCEAAYWIAEHAFDARFAVETCTDRETAADAVDRLCGDRVQLVSAVRAELGLPPLSGPPLTSGPAAEDLR